MRPAERRNLTDRLERLLVACTHAQVFMDSDAGCAARQGALLYRMKK